MDEKNGISPAALRALVEGDMENFVIAATPGGIEEQQAREQKRLAKTTLLPKDCRHPYLNMDSWPLLEKQGVRRGEEDGLFYRCELPAGWRIEPTEHHMWSRLVDGAGRTRARYFYKAAFYDRDAILHLCTRYGVRWEPDHLRIIHDGESEMHRVQGVAVAGDEGKWVAGDRAWKDARDWLTERYPNWRDPSAYWDE